LFVVLWMMICEREYYYYKLPIPAFSMIGSYLD